MTTRQLQHDLNAFTGRYLKHVGRLRVDGRMGPATRKRIKLAKYYLGYVPEYRTTKVDRTFLNRLHHPHRKRYFAGHTFARAKRRRSYQRKHAKPPRRRLIARLVGRGSATGVGSFDGLPCAAVAVPILVWCRQNGWQGRLNSGWRSRQYSQHLCYAMCGRPSCPGRCAGVATNHVGITSGQFAVDVTDYVTFGRVVARCPIQPRIFNALGARDPVHFSPSGR